MAWLRDPAWLQGIALLLVLAGTVLIYLGAHRSGELDGGAMAGVILFAAGNALPLLVELRRKQRSGQTDDV